MSNMDVLFSVHLLCCFCDGLIF